jgi:uncharacterized protein (UPF0332 family)
VTTQAEIVRYRVERAQDSLREARLLADGGLWSACVNRLYYACFYAVSALLLSRGLSSSKHTGVRSLFNSNFVKTEEVSRELGAVYNDLFENRQKSDYMDFVRFDEDQVRPWIVDAQLFVATIGALAVVAEESDQERATKD